MTVLLSQLPERLYLERYNGDYHKYIDAVYSVFKNDFIDSKPIIEDIVFKLKFNPKYQNRAYTFYHMTHEGDIEHERTPDLRRCERMPWCKPGIERTKELSLRFWEQERHGSHRICIWLDVEKDDDNPWQNNYFIILDVRKGYVLPWTAFCAKYHHDVEKKEKEYQKWKQSVGTTEYTLYTLIQDIMNRIK